MNIKHIEISKNYIKSYFEDGTYNTLNINLKDIFDAFILQALIEQIYIDKNRTLYNKVETLQTELLDYVYYLSNGGAYALSTQLLDIKSQIVVSDKYCCNLFNKEISINPKETDIIEQYIQTYIIANIDINRLVEEPVFNIDDCFGTYVIDYINEYLYSKGICIKKVAVDSDKSSHTIRIIVGNALFYESIVEINKTISFQYEMQTTFKSSEDITVIIDSDEKYVCEMVFPFWYRGDVVDIVIKNLGICLECEATHRKTGIKTRLI